MDPLSVMRILLAAKEAEVEQLREALIPFAAKYEDFTPDPISVRMQMATHPDDLGDDRLALVTLQIGDVRRAVAVLKATAP